MPSTIDDEWKVAAAAGAAARRKALVPKLVGGLAFAVVFAAIFAAGGFIGAREAKRREELRAQGIETVVVKRSLRTGSSRRLDSNEEGADAGLSLFLLAFGGGAFAGVLAFFATGGKLSAEHARGWKQL